MRRTLLSGLTLAASLLLPLAAETPLAAQAAAAPAAVATARVIVKYRADSPLLRAQAMTPAGRRLLQTRALSQRIGVALTPGRPITDRIHVVFGQGLTSQQLATQAVGAERHRICGRRRSQAHRVGAERSLLRHRSGVHPGGAGHGDVRRAGWSASGT